MSVYLNDCLFELKRIDNESINTIYLDPPFFTQKKQSLKNRDGKEYSFDDCWNSMDTYIEFLRLRIQECKRVLKKDGTIFVQCDSTASAYIKIMLDNVFGYDNFRSEIIWTYKRWSNSQNSLLPAHQTIFLYSKSKNYKFNKIYTSYSVTTNIDQILQDRIRDERGKTVYKTDSNGLPIHDGQKIGVPLSDVWDIPLLNPKAKERVGYPTQKPILLLEQIIRISTDENDIVLDPFCGSGTTLIAAKLLNRNFIGIDINPDAVELSQKRLLLPVKTQSQLLLKGHKMYDTKNEKEKFLLNLFDCEIVQRNKGIDGFLRKKYNNSMVAIRIQKENESFSCAVNVLKMAAEKKFCNYMILVKTNFDSISHINIPTNMLVLSTHTLEWENDMRDQEWTYSKLVSM